MLTLISTALSFLMGGLPKLMDFFQDKSDKSHELEMARMQTERELQMLERGYAAQARVEEIRTEQVQMETQAQERSAMYAHDIAIGQGASQWVINLRASVRPAVTYLFVFLLMIVDIASIAWAWSSGTSFVEAIPMVFDADEMQILASIIAFWFGTQAFSKK
jgi:VIT1/CCC1 family predicted Fe2+/Mn2+ transporter